MLLFGSHTWRGESRTHYRFKVTLTAGGIPHNSGGIYVFVRRRLGFFLEPLYVGKAADLHGRLIGHEKWSKAYWWYGATERHVLRVATETERRRIEEDLIRGLKPRMNDVMIPNGARDAPSDAKLRWRWFERNWRRLAQSPKRA
jgi:hypothetical protein